MKKTKNVTDEIMKELGDKFKIEDDEYYKQLEKEAAEYNKNKLND